MSDIKDQILEDIKEALRNRDEIKLRALRLIQAEIKNLEIQKRPDPIEKRDVIALINKQLKQYKETIKELVDAGRSQAAEEELAQVECLKEYLPPEINEEELVQIVKDVISSTEPKGLSDQGLVIKEVQKRVDGRADNVRIVQLIRKSLEQL